MSSGHFAGDTSSRYDVPIDFVAGSLGATASVYVGQPLDTLKVILIISVISVIIVVVTMTTPVQVKMQTFPQLYPRLSTCFTQTLAKEGVVRGEAN